MELNHSTDYFAAIPFVPVNSRLEPNQLANIQRLRQRIEADMFLIVMVAATLFAVAILICNCSR